MTIAACFRPVLCPQVRLALFLSVRLSPLSGFVYLSLAGPDMELQTLWNYTGGGGGLQLSPPPLSLQIRSCV